jgi:hypothetical protein
MRQLSEASAYYVTEDGRVWSSHTNRYLKPTYNHKGYAYVKLGRGKSTTKSVHSLVLLAYVGVRPEGMQINHKDGDKTNNALINLEYCTPSENIKHALRTGLRNERYGVEHHNAKLDDASITRIRSLLGTMTQYDIAKMFNVSPQTISRLKRGETYNAPA